MESRWATLFISLSVILFAAFGPGLIANGLYIHQWQPVWVQAITSVIAVAIAVIVPIVFETLRRKDEERKEKAISLSALQAVYGEVRHLKDFFMHVKFRLDLSDLSSLHELAAGQSPIDPGLDLSVSGDKFSIISALSGEVAGAYMNAVSKRVILINHLSEISRLIDSCGSEIDREAFIRKTVVFLNAKRVGEEGWDYCNKVTSAAEKADPSLSYGIKLQSA